MQREGLSSALSQGGGKGGRTEKEKPSSYQRETLCFIDLFLWYLCVRITCTAVEVKKLLTGRLQAMPVKVWYHVSVQHCS